jgi:hypothetical protein
MNTATEPTSREIASPPARENADTAEDQRSETEIFEQLRSYPFTLDREFAQGLAIILGHPEVPASEEETSRSDDLVLQAKCYYFARYALC